MEYLVAAAILFAAYFFYKAYKNHSKTKNGPPTYRP